MITKIKMNSRSSRRNYDSYEDLDYIGDGVMINNRQRKTLIDLYSRNLQESERENRICELDNLTSLEAEEIIFQFLSATWH